MRINVYAEELTGETALVTKEVDDETFGPRTFKGVRFFLASPDVLHNDPDDDDRSAITLWARADDTDRIDTLWKMLSDMAELAASEL